MEQQPRQATESRRRGIPPVSVCTLCGAATPPDVLTEPGVRVLVALARVGLGAGAPPVLSPEHEGD